MYNTRNNPEDESEDKVKQIATSKKSDLLSVWVLHIDGASNAQDSGAGLILTNSEGVITEYVLRFNFKASNNQAEYKALLAGLRIVKELDIDSLKIFTDSQLIAGQVKSKFEVRDPIIMKYLQNVKDLTSTLKYFEIFYIPRIKNAQADILSRLTSTSSFNSLDRTFIEYLEQLSIDKVEKVLQLTDEPSWIDLIIQYLTDGTLPMDPSEVKRLSWTVSQYILMNSHLYKRSFSLLLLKCLGPTDDDYALREVHGKICENYLGGKALAYKVL